MPKHEPGDTRLERRRGMTPGLLGKIEGISAPPPSIFDRVLGDRFGGMAERLADIIVGKGEFQDKPGPVDMLLSMFPIGSPLRIASNRAKSIKNMRIGLKQSMENRIQSAGGSGVGEQNLLREFDRLSRSHPRVVASSSRNLRGWVDDPRALAMYGPLPSGVDRRAGESLVGTANRRGRAALERGYPLPNEVSVEVMRRFPGSSDIFESLAHEFTHGAQAIRRSVPGNVANPLMVSTQNEISAHTAGMNQSIIRQLREARQKDLLIDTKGHIRSNTPPGLGMLASFPDLPQHQILPVSQRSTARRIAGMYGQAAGTAQGLTPRTPFGSRNPLFALLNETRVNMENVIKDVNRQISMAYSNRSRQKILDDGLSLMEGIQDNFVNVMKKNNPNLGIKPY